MKRRSLGPFEVSQERVDGRAHRRVTGQPLADDPLRQLDGQTADFTSQLFFADSLNAEVFAQQPYSQKTGSWLKNSGDGIYTGGGDKLLLSPTKGASGYTATFDIGIA